jgi:hypothetical protein
VTRTPEQTNGADQHDTATGAMQTGERTGLEWTQQTGVEHTDTTTPETTMTADDTTRTESSTTATTAGGVWTRSVGDRSTEREIMSDVDQTHPDTNRTFGFRVYGRGVVTDGGHRQEKESMEDVDHESETDGANRTFDRGQHTDDGNE